ncbi:MAG: O-methyltransferase [Bacteroidetes bacterium]|nr:O-methyltransferase [Bacteroidota bacterium]
MSDPQLESYLETHCSPPGEVLHDLWRHTWLHTIYPRMAAGPQHGLLLSMLCRMLKPERVLEIGTFTGYAAIAMAQACPEDARLTSIEANEEHLSIAGKYIRRAGLEHKIRLVHGDASTVLPDLNESFDLVYLDADKISYPDYFPMIRRLLRSGGWLLADNVLWGGKVVNPSFTDRETEALRKFNHLVSEDPDFEQLILPLHDGLLIAHRRH